MKPRLIVIEGIDGAGGETQSNLLLDYLKEKSIPAEKLQYPDYSSAFGKAIDDWLHKKIEFNTETLFLLYTADMVKDQERIRSLLNSGHTVIIDRYITSTMAYQTVQGLPLEKILKFTELFNIQKPDLILFLDIKPETSLDRKEAEKGSLDRNESRRDFQSKISSSYKNLIDRQVFSSWFVVNGEASVEDVSSRIKKILRI